jgi:hypothetical protein
MYNTCIELHLVQSAAGRGERLFFNEHKHNAVRKGVGIACRNGRHKDAGRAM